MAARLTQDASTSRVLAAGGRELERTRAMTVPDAWPQLLGSQADWAASPSTRRTRGRWPTPGAGPWAAPTPSTPWPTCAGTGRSTTAGPRAGRGQKQGFRGPAARISGAASHPDGEGRDPALRGTEGPVRVAPAAETARHPVAARVRRGLGRRSAVRLTDDLEAAHQQEGVAWVDLAIDGGQRIDPAGRLPAARPAPPEPDGRSRLFPGNAPARGHGRCTDVSYTRDGAPIQAASTDAR